MLTQGRGEIASTGILPFFLLPARIVPAKNNEAISSLSAKTLQPMSKPRSLAFGPESLRPMFWK